MATFIKISLGNSVSLRLIQKNKRLQKFPFIATNNWIVWAAQWSVKYFFCSEFPDIPEKFWRRRRSKRSAVQWQCNDTHAVVKGNPWFYPQKTWKESRDTQKVLPAAFMVSMYLSLEKRESTKQIYCSEWPTGWKLSQTTSLPSWKKVLEGNLRTGRHKRRLCKDAVVEASNVALEKVQWRGFTKDIAPFTNSNPKEFLQ